MQVYVLNQDSKPLMPCGPAKARRLLREQQARVVKRTPFTIQLLYGSSGYKQPITLGVDAGYKIIGLSAVTEKKEVFSGELQLRNDIVELLSVRKCLRAQRRDRKTRYRKVRSLNRVSMKKAGWIAPSIKYKIETHERIINKIHEILPVTKIIVEVFSFNKNLNVFDKYNIRAYVLHRDNHRCRGRSGCKSKILQVHHIESRKTGGNAANNLLTLCKDCHAAYHNGSLKLNLKRGTSVKDMAFMNFMRHRLYKYLESCYNSVTLTYGYLTKNLRIESGLEKSHRNDALCITGNTSAVRSGGQFLMRQFRRHNRQIHKAKILKAGIRRRNQAPYLLYGFRLFDKILYKDKEYLISGRRAFGYFELKDYNGIKSVPASPHYRHLRLIEPSRAIMWHMLNVKNLFDKNLIIEKTNGWSALRNE